MYRVLLTAGFLIGTGCRSTETQNETGDWWSSPDSAATDTEPIDTGKGGGKDTGKGGGKDTGKGGGKDTGKGGADTSGSITGILIPASGTGSMTRSFAVDDEPCIVAYTTSDFTALTTCESCDFAWSFTASAGTLTKGDSSCTDEDDPISEQTLRWGQGQTTIAEKDGTAYYELLAEKNGAWTALPDSFSWTGDKTESGDSWNIYIFI
jgi:hypothetical protein